MKLNTENEKMQYIRDRWDSLKLKGMLRRAIMKLQIQHPSWRQWDTDFIIDIEESAPEFLNKGGD